MVMNVLHFPADVAALNDDQDDESKLMFVNMTSRSGQDFPREPDIFHLTYFS